jgi:hypothetical protein
VLLHAECLSSLGPERPGVFIEPKVYGEYYNFFNFFVLIINIYLIPIFIPFVKKDEMGRVCSTNGEKRNAYRILVGMPEGKRTLGRPRRKCVHNIKMDLRDI